MDTSTYFRATETSDALLQERQRQIRTAEDAGDITVREAADLRVSALTSHLAACREARQRYLDGSR
jgi:hypothetical protein